MPFQVTIEPSQHRFAIEAGQPILQAALDAGFMLPYGCRDGVCGSCKGKLLSGVVDYGKYQDSALSAEEKRGGYVLFCCAKPLSDIAIECREIGAAKDIPIKTLPCRVQKMERLAPDVMVLSLKLPGNERLQFLPGQYLDILLKNGRRRSFSLANAPHDDELLQLHLRLASGGHFTQHVFKQMKEKDILRFTGPLGSFFLREDGDKPMLFVAGGTGFAPIKSMIEHALHHGTTRPMALYWGARSRADLYQSHLPELWRTLNSQLKYVSVLSAAKPEDDWRGRTGLVHQAVLDDYGDLSGYQVYVCGAPVMVDAARHDFIALRNLPPEEFFADSFSFAADSATTED